MPRCAAKTKLGKQCKNKCLEGKYVCHVHSVATPEAKAESKEGDFLSMCARPYVKAILDYMKSHAKSTKKTVENEGIYMAYEIFFDNYSDEAYEAMMISAKANNHVELAKTFKKKVYNALIEGVMEESNEFKTPPKSTNINNMTESQLYGHVKSKIKNYF